LEIVEVKQRSIQRATLVVASITNFSNTFAASAINIAIPHVGSEYQASATAVSWIVLAFVLASALLSIPFGRLADIYGRMRIMKLGIALFCAASFLNMFSPNMAVFLLFRVLQGAGAAMVFATNTAILVDVYPAEKRGSVMGIAVAAVFTGSAMGPVIGGLITHAFGWRNIFLFITAFSMIAFVTALIKLPNDSAAGKKEKINTASIVLFVLSLGLFMYGLATLKQNLMSYFAFAAGVLLIIVFVRHETRTEVPVVEVRLFRNREFTFANLAALFNFMAVFAVIYLMSIYLQLARGFSADYAGIIMIAQPVVQAVLSPFAGRLADKRSPSVIASIGMGCCTAALFMFIFINETTPVIYIIAGLLVTGLGIALFSSPNSSRIMGSVANKDYGVASSIMSTARIVGQGIGMALLTIIINAVIGNVPIAEVAPALIVRNIQITFPIFTAICAAGIVFSLMHRKGGGADKGVTIAPEGL